MRAVSKLRRVIRPLSDRRRNDENSNGWNGLHNRGECEVKMHAAAAFNDAPRNGSVDRACNALGERIACIRGQPDVHLIRMAGLEYARIGNHGRVGSDIVPLHVVPGIGIVHIGGMIIRAGGELRRVIRPLSCRRRIDGNRNG